jgi:hypothetical protein
MLTDSLGGFARRSPATQPSASAGAPGPGDGRVASPRAQARREGVTSHAACQGWA